MKTTAKPRIAVLDGLRALAIVMVMGRHSVRAFWPHLTEPFAQVGPVDLGDVLINGWIGVDLFFVLSGFLITSHLLEVAKTDLKVYYKRRFFRVAPAYYLVLTLAVIGALPFFPYPQSHDHLAWRYVYHLAFMQDYFPSDIIVLFWTLALEAKFYLLVPFVVMLTRTSERLLVKIYIPLLILVTQPFLRLWTVGHLPPFGDYETFFESIRSVFHLCLDGFAVGMICAYLMKFSKKTMEKKLVANGLFGAGALIILSLAFSKPLVDVQVSLFDMTLLNSVIALGFGGMMLGLLGGCAGHRFFQGKVLTFIALISYSLYLLHLPALYVAEVAARKVIDFNAFPDPVLYVMYLPFFVAISMMAATLMYVLVEKPFIDWSRKR